MTYLSSPLNASASIVEILFS